MLTVRNLNKNFRKKEVLKGFTYDFDCGVYGLLGPNGTGKTTLIRCITGVYNIKKDTVLYNGKCITNDKNYLSTVGYLPQKFGLFKDLKVREMMELMASLKNVDKAKTKPMIEKCAELVNLSDRMEDRVSTLSGGMIRRLGIAQALIGDPAIIIFDEPTAGLDPEERLRFKNIISQIKKDKVIIISTHIVEDVEASCDTVVIMKNGSIGASGSCSQIKEIAQGKTYLVSEDEKESIKGDYIIQRQFEENGRNVMKILSGSPQNLEQVNPSVEDGYICVLKNI